MNKLTVNSLLCVLYCFAGCLLSATIHAETSEQADLEFLEFLAEWQSDQGEWLYPLDMQELAQNEQTVQPTEVQGDE